MSTEYVRSGGVAGTAVTVGRNIVFAFLASAILLLPSLGQVFGYSTPWARQWIMFSGVGVGTLKGTFRLSKSGHGTVEMTPLEVLDHKVYPVIRHYLFKQRVREAHDLIRFADRLCAELGPDDRLSFDGVMGTRQGWQALNVDDICNMPAEQTETEASGGEQRR